MAVLIVAASLCGCGGSGSSRPDGASGSSRGTSPQSATVNVDSPLAACVRAWDSSHKDLAMSKSDSVFGEANGGAASVQIDPATNGCVVSFENAINQAWWQVAFLGATVDTPYAVASSEGGGTQVMGLGSQNVAECPRGGLAGFGVACPSPTAAGMATPQTGAATTSAATGATSGADAGVADYVSEVTTIVQKSRHQLAKIVHAITLAPTSPDQALSLAGSAVSGRQALIATAQGLIAPPSFGGAQQALLTALQLSKESDDDYYSWILRKSGGEPGQANAAYAKAQTNDPRATAAKKRFFRLMNAALRSSGYSPLSAKKLF